MSWYVDGKFVFFISSIRNSKECNAIMNSAREAVKGYQFQQDENSVRLLNGTEEGTFGWITVNILTGALEAHRVR